MIPYPGGAPVTGKLLDRDVRVAEYLKPGLQHAKMLMNHTTLRKPKD